MAKQVSQDLATAAAPPQGKLCPYDEEKPAIWFRLIEEQSTDLNKKTLLYFFKSIIKNIGNNFQLISTN